METQIKDGCERPVELLQIPNWNLPPDFKTLNRHLVCFIVGDASKTSDEQIYSFAEQLLQKGMVHMCAWGPDCGRVHDITDSAVVEAELEIDDESTIMTV